MEGKTKAVWKELEFLQPDKIWGARKNSAIGEGIYYRGIWQEIVVYDSEEAIKWAVNIIR